MRRTTRKALIALAIPLFCGAPLRAQDGAERSAEAIDVEDTREAEPLYEDSPVEKQVIREQEIRELPSRTAADVVTTLPGIRTQSRVQGEDAAVSIEGMPPEYTLILVNGQRYTGQIGEVADLADIPVENVERIEVLRGAQALRYGSEAAGGVINIITKRAPEAETGWEARVEGGGGNDGQIRGNLNGGVNAADARFTLAVDHDQIRGYDPCTDCGAVFTVGGSSKSRESNEDVYATLGYDGFEDLELRGSFGWRLEDERIVPLEGDASDQGFTRWLGGSGFTWNLGERTTLRSDLNWYNGILDSTTGRSFTQDETELRLEAGIDHIFETGPFEHVLTFGADARRPTLDLDEGAPPENLSGLDIPEGDVRESFQILGLYLQNETALTEWASFVAGVRGEIHSNFDDVVLPQAALLFRPTDWARLRFSFGLNSRTPSLADLYQPPVPQLGGTYFLSGNPDLVRERSTNYRAGFELNPWKQISLSSTYFYNDISELIRSVLAGEIVTGTNTIVIPAVGGPFCAFDPTLPECTGSTIVSELTSPVFQKTNLNSVVTQGVETQLVVRPHPSVTLQAAYTFQLTSLEDPNLVGIDELPNEPIHVVDLQAYLTLPWSGTIVTPHARFRSRALTESSGTGLSSFVTGVYSEPSWLVDLRITQPILDRYAVYLDLANLTNTQVVDSYQVRGRTFFVGVRAALGPTPPRRRDP
ncbi:Colicin I receptor [Myxococcaceae bacterium]|jgi:outer membrane receptor for ferrienterochelin and colicins|nr:Colicin I receptor [Myxococcaceae bacterium]